MAKSPSEFIFEIGILIALGVVTWYGILTSRFYPLLRELKPQDYPEFSNICDIWWIPFCSALFLHGIKRVTMAMVCPLLAPYCKNQDDPEML